MILETAVLVPVVTGVSEVIKRLGKLQSDCMPFVSLIVGIVLALVGYYTLPEISISLGEAIFMGLIAGLSGAGLYDTGKAAFSK